MMLKTKVILAQEELLLLEVYTTYYDIIEITNLQVSCPAIVSIQVFISIAASSVAGWSIVSPSYAKLQQVTPSYTKLITTYIVIWMWPFY